MNNLEDLLMELENYEVEKPLYIEVDGVHHRITRVEDDSQGVYIVVDKLANDQEDW